MSTQFTCNVPHSLNSANSSWFCQVKMARNAPSQRGRKKTVPKKPGTATIHELSVVSDDEDPLFDPSTEVGHAPQSQAAANDATAPESSDGASSRAGSDFEDDGDSVDEILPAPSPDSTSGDDDDDDLLDGEASTASPSNTSSTDKGKQIIDA